MPFNSSAYLLFFVITVCVSWALAGRPRIRIFFLLLASYYFYESNNGSILLILMLSTLVDYVAGILIEDSDSPRRRKLCLLVSLGFNLGLLGFFKYFNFFMDSIETVMAGFGNPVALPAPEILLPVGISFYTFQSISYILDVYAGRLKAERNLLNFAFFIAFFPHLVAGPIVRAKYFLHQIPQPPQLTDRGFEGALYLIFIGLLKKIVLADTLADYADAGFSDPASATALTAWLALYAFTFQIYFDFSGYTEIAVGCARLMGFRLPPNFRRPYTAVSFSEFWRRWHISLSFWLRDYLYKPLGGNRGGKWPTSGNLMITMVLGGLWHGASWTFVIWGAAHGLLLLAERMLGLAAFARDYAGRPWARFARSFIVFNLVALTWLPFRATDLDNLRGFAAAMVRFETPPVITAGMAAAALIIVGGLCTQWLGERFSLKRFALRQPFLLRALFYGGVIVLVAVFSTRGAEPFIYFRF